MSSLVWGDPEWFDLNDGVYAEAFAASDTAFLTECEVTRRPDEDKWFFMVKATSNLSEWPEVQAAGPCTTADEGKAKCEAIVAEIESEHQA